MANIKLDGVSLPIPCLTKESLLEILGYDEITIKAEDMSGKQVIAHVLGTIDDCPHTLLATGTGGSFVDSDYLSERIGTVDNVPDIYYYCYYTFKNLVIGDKNYGDFDINGIYDRLGSYSFLFPETSAYIQLNADGTVWAIDEGERGSGLRVSFDSFTVTALCFIPDGGFGITVWSENLKNERIYADVRIKSNGSTIADTRCIGTTLDSDGNGGIFAEALMPQTDAQLEIEMTVYCTEESTYTGTANLVYTDEGPTVQDVSFTGTGCVEVEGMNV